jgi:hypothetical protein
MLSYSSALCVLKKLFHGEFFCEKTSYSQTEELYSFQFLLPSYFDGKSWSSFSFQLLPLFLVSKPHETSPVLLNRELKVATLSALAVAGLSCFFYLLGKRIIFTLYRNTYKCASALTALKHLLRRARSQQVVSFI